MSAIVDYTFYSTEYMGMDAQQASFPALCARAEDVIGAMTKWKVNAANIEQLPALVQMLYKKAICAQIDALAINGTDSVAVQNAAGGGFTVGKVTVHARAYQNASAKGMLADAISPMALAYLEQTGLMNPQVDTANEPFIAGWWY